MSLTINSNSMALNAQRNLVRSNNALATVFKRLSSGMRINSAKDDAAGLSVSTRMEAQIREHNQAIRNVNDGISMAQVAEGGMQEAMNTLQRMRELAVQAANDTYTSGDRADLELELDQLKSHLNSIASDTEFNGQKLLDGSLTGKKIHVGENDSVSLDISQSVAATATAGTISRDNLLAEYTFDGNANDSSGNGYNGTVDGATLTNDRSENTDSAYIFDGVNDKVEISGNQALGQLTGDATVSFWTKISANNFDGGEHRIIDKDSGDYWIFMIQNNTLRLKVADVGNSTENFNILTSDEVDSNAWYNIVSTKNGTNFSVYANGSLIESRDTTISNVLPAIDLVFGYSAFWNSQYFEGEIDDVLIYDKALSQNEIQSQLTLNDASVSTQSQAEVSISVIDNYIDAYSDQQASLGAFQNRLESISSNLATMSENTSQARSRIMDADIAQETANLTTASIIQQATVAILAQANQQPQIALQLLG